jgi:hypothetical protein
MLVAILAIAQTRPGRPQPGERTTRISRDGQRIVGTVVDNDVTAPAGTIGHIGAFFGHLKGAPGQEMHGYIFAPRLIRAGTGVHPGVISAVAIAAPPDGGGQAKAAATATLLIESNPPCTWTKDGKSCYALLVDAGRSRFDSDIELPSPGTGIECSGRGECYWNLTGSGSSWVVYQHGAKRLQVNPEGQVIVHNGLKLEATENQVCSSSTRGTFRYTAGSPHEKDSVQVCAKDASDRYAWRLLY